MAPTIDSNERELILQLLEDVGVIETQFAPGLPKPQATRAIFTPILRRWIIDGKFHQAQRLVAPAKVSFMIFTNGQSIKLCKAGVYEHWMGLLSFGAISIMIGKVAKKYRGADGKPTVELGDVSKIGQLPQRGSIFFDQKIFYWKGRFYTRADMIRMHANKLGGVHIDFRRGEDETHINEIKNYFGFEVKGTNNQMLVGEEIGHARADPTRREHVYDAPELIVMDTARIFLSGIRESESVFRTLLK